MWRTSEILGYSIRATDDQIGSIDDLLFDDETWTIRWAVVDTGFWLSGRKVLLPPSCFGTPATAAREFRVGLTRQQVEDSPDIGTDQPVSSQMETDVYDYYGWAPYWPIGYPPVRASGGYLPPVGTPGAAAARTGTGASSVEREIAAIERRGDPHLHSVNEVTGYYIGARDDEIGHVEEFLVEDKEWVIRYMVVDTRNWWPGKKVLVSPKWIRDVSWTDEQIRVDLTRDQVKDSPEFAPQTPVDRSYEIKLYSHYGFPPYWM